MSDESFEDQALDASYRRLASHEAGAPSEATRRAILVQARGIAAARAVNNMRPRASMPWARPALFGALAASVVAGLLVVPRWRLPVAAPAPPEARLGSPAPVEAQIQMKSAADSVAAPVLPRAEPAPAPAVAQLHLEEAPPIAAPAPASAPATGGVARPADSAIANSTTTHVAAAPALAAAPQLPGAQLRRAAETGDLAQLEALSRGQPDLNARDAQGRTALMLATRNGHANAVAALLAYGADPRVADAQGVTPVAAARAAGDAEVLAVFARYGLR